MAHINFIKFAYSLYHSTSYFLKTIINLLETRTSIIIGSSSSAQLVVNDKSIAPMHAVVFKEGFKYWVKDLATIEGSYLNGRRISDSPIEIKPDDILLLGLNQFKINADINSYRSGIAIAAKEISKVSGSQTLLQSLSIELKKGEFIALMGPSGCGKSTLMKCLNGASPATAGEVIIYGLNLGANIPIIKRRFGYVPQEDIVHENLSIWDCLYFGAKLRLSPHIGEDKISERIREVLDLLNLNKPELVNRKIHQLSGGQRKRVSIGIELLNNPEILFLDEPTSPLDPETVDDFLGGMKRFCKENDSTIVMVTHKPEDLKYVDRVLFLGVNGYLVYDGAPGDINDYFKCDRLVEVYEKVYNLELSRSFYEKLRIKNQIRSNAESTVQPELKYYHGGSRFYQTKWLARRLFKIKYNDRMTFISQLLLQPVIIAMVICVVFSKLTAPVLFLMVLSAVWFGVNNSAKEIVDEKHIFQRERTVYLSLSSYINSKFIVLMILGSIQIFILLSICFINFYSTLGNQTSTVFFLNSSYFVFFICECLILSASILTGLGLSTLFKSSEKVMSFLPIFLMPQVMLSGALSPLNNATKDGMGFMVITRWGTELIARVQDFFYSGKSSIFISASKKIKEPNVTSLRALGLDESPLIKDLFERIAVKSEMGKIWFINAVIVIICLFTYRMIWSGLKATDPFARDSYSRRIMYLGIKIFLVNIVVFLAFNILIVKDFEYKNLLIGTLMLYLTIRIWLADSPYFKTGVRTERPKWNKL